MRILLMGDFSGRENGGIREPGSLADRPTPAVDIDNFEDVLRRITPRLRLSNGTKVEIRELDDFHPDGLYLKLELFQALRDLRSRLLDPATFAQASMELRPTVAGKTTEVRPSQDAGVEQQEDDAATIDRLLGGKQVRRSEGSQRTERSLDTFIKSIVEPHIVSDSQANQEVYVHALDEAIGELMRALLHHPEFQALESGWRGVHRLVTSLETGEELSLHLLDVSKQELAAELGSRKETLEESGLYKLLVDKGPATLGGYPWSLLVGNYTFDTDPEDLSLLAALGAIASQAGAPFLAAADPSVLGCQNPVLTPDPSEWRLEDPEITERWQTLRQSSPATWIGLALPRVLMRLPYGDQTDPIERFQFEELTSPCVHESYLWGNPAFFCAMLIAQSFLDSGWSMQPGVHLDIDDLPAHTYLDADESKLQACAETFLSERAAEQILALGIMPLLSHRSANTARVMRFQSLADPPAQLAGPWCSNLNNRT